MDIPERHELLATMAVVAAGAMLGRIQLRGVRLDVAAMLLLGAAVAHFGITLSPSLGLFGLLLFLYVVGVKAGPAVRGMRRREAKLAGAGVAVGLAVVAGTVLGGRLLGLPAAAGLGTAFGFCGSGASLALLGPADSSGAAAGFAVAAPIGSLFVMLFVQVGQGRWVKKIAAEVETWNQDMARAPERPENATIRVEREEIRSCTLDSLRPPCQVLWVERGGDAFAAEADTHLEAGDLIHVSGTKETVEAAAALLGRLLPARGPRPTDAICVRKFFISNSDVIGVRVDRLQLRTRFGATVTRVRRAGVTLLPRPGQRFRWGDRVQVSVPSQHVDELRKLFGDDAHGLEELAFPRAALTIFLGGLLGAVPIEFGNTQAVRIGPAVGVLIVSMFAAALHRTGPVVWSQSGPTLRTLSHIGLPLFLAQVGNASYDGLRSAWADYGLLLFVLAIVPGVLLVMLAMLAKRVWRLGPLTVLAFVPSVALNTPALSALQERYREKIPGHVYAAVYPFVMVTVLLVALVASVILAGSG